jgi:glycosyltransferase involved in cell wall biosynthesis
VTPPPLAVGLPVYNGARFLGEALESILAQTYGDFELIISDNASTDATADICREFSADRRIRYYRQPANFGAAVNYTTVFTRSSSPLFKWAAHDDLCAPDLFEKSIAALDAHPDAVMAFARTVSIDADGRQLKVWRRRPGLGSADARVRADDVLMAQTTFPMWGVARRDVLARTGLLGSFVEHDRRFIYEMALHGPFVEVEDTCFFEREHSGRSVRVFDPTDPHRAAEWYDARLKGRLIFPTWRLLAEYLRALHRSPLPARRSGPLVADLARWAGRHRAELVRDLSVAAARMPLLGDTYQEIASRSAARRWRRRVDATILALEVVPDGGRLVLIDEGVLDRSRLQRVEVREFPDADGVWAGLPASPADAIERLDAEIATGASHLALVSSSRWWLDHYDAFARHLAVVATRVVDAAEVEVYELHGERRSRETP